MALNIAIVDTGCANLASVAFACERIGAAYEITANADKIVGAKRVIIPGVGAAPHAMAALHRRNLVSILQQLTQPVMGICLGMQLLFEQSDENGGTQCLGMIPGTVSQLDTKGKPAPHMGWNKLNIMSDDPILMGVKTGDYVYFVHSYAAQVSDYTLASSIYGSAFTAILKQGNIYGCQFHPERSGAVGARILKNFVGL